MIRSQACIKSELNFTMYVDEVWEQIERGLSLGTIFRYLRNRLTKVLR